MVGGERLARHRLEDIGYLMVATLAPTSLHQAKRDMGDVLDPLEIADNDAASIDEEVGRITMPRSRSCASASNVVGPFAPSTISRAWMAPAFRALMELSMAAGMRMSKGRINPSDARTWLCAYGQDEAALA